MPTLAIIEHVLVPIARISVGKYSATQIYSASQVTSTKEIPIKLRIITGNY